MKNELKVTSDMFPSGTIIAGVDTNGLTCHMYKPNEQSNVIHTIKTNHQGLISHAVFQSATQKELMQSIGGISALRQPSSLHSIAMLNGFMGLNITYSDIDIPSAFRVATHSDFPRTPLSKQEVNDAVGCMLAQAFLRLIKLIEPRYSNPISSFLSVETRTDIFGNKSPYVDIDMASIIPGDFMNNYPYVKVVMKAILSSCSQLRDAFLRDIEQDNESEIYELCAAVLPQTEKQVCKEINAICGKYRLSPIKLIVMFESYRNVEALATVMMSKRINARLQ
nr:hypothetical protein [Vibrio splendidus]MCC4882470.1 hypothetical protein [Vibrio splendidus]